MSFKDVMGHERPINLLQRAIAQEKVVHSYLFLGSEGIGKSLVALQFAKALNCLEGENKPDGCDRCPSCKKIDHRLHPDVSLIEPEGQTLKVDQVREMQRALAYRPYEGRRRVFILTAADRMAPNMSNTLLKTLEEPPLHTLIILLANSPKWILPTILSRCQSIRFNPLPSHLVSDWLAKEKGLEEKEAHLLASLSEGSPGKALEIKEEIAGIPRKELLMGWMGLKSLSIEEQEGWVESLPSQRENLYLILEMAKTLLRDLIVVKTLKDGSRLIHSDLTEEMEQIAGEWDLSSLLRRMEILHQTSQAIKGNANTRLSLEAMMIFWAEG
ncbi:MAG: DNA polymerase III subunit delta' [Thermodesulfobacteriota bacterium]|nr:DNA polymerase III subunit delta' [Thermodesulfobacteriota bacterium]